MTDEITIFPWNFWWMEDVSNIYEKLFILQWGCCMDNIEYNKSWESVIQIYKISKIFKTHFQLNN